MTVNMLDTIEITPRYCETDQMGVIYHTRYLDWFEVGRTTLFRRLGLPYRCLEEAGVHLPVLEASVRWLKPARYDCPVTVVTEVLRFAHGLVEFKYRVIEDETLLVRGSTKHVFVRNGKRLPLDLNGLKTLLSETGGPQMLPTREGRQM